MAPTSHKAVEIGEAQMKTGTPMMNRPVYSWEVVRRAKPNSSSLPSSFLIAKSPTPMKTISNNNAMLVSKL